MNSSSIRYNRLLIMIFLVAVYLISCKKNTSDQPESALSLITNTKWQLNALYLSDSPYVERTNFTTQYYSSCELNDTYAFRMDSTLSRKSSDTSCKQMLLVMPDDGATWHLDSANTYLVIAKQNFFNTYLYNCKILTLNKNVMELQNNFRDYFNHPSAYIFSFRATQ